MGILDRYIIRKYIGTFGFILLLLTIIVLVIDVQSKKPRITDNNFEVSYFLVHYYPFWIIYLIMLFMSILVFISVIFFTSRMANNTEIVAIISSGASFHRFARPYLIASGTIALFALVVNHLVLPWANVQKNKLEVYTMNAINRDKFLGTAPVSAQLSRDEYIFVNSYDKKNKRGTGLSFQRYNKDKKLTYQILASNISWQTDKKVFQLDNAYEKTILKDDSERLAYYPMLEKSFKKTPEELFPDELLGQNKPTPELLRFIESEKQRGNANLTSYYNELHQRTSMPVAVIILTFLALSLSSEKRRGGLGLNLAIGIALAFIFVFSFEALKVVSDNKTLPPALAMWLPNIVFAPVALFLYFRRANQ